MHRGLRLRGNTDEGTAAVVARLVTYAVIAIGLGVALSTLGANLGALFAAGAFFAIALGFAMQNVAENFVGGLILLTERTIKPGDVIEVEGRVVRVTRMGLRATVARSRDDEDLIVPNASLVTNTVKNYTLRDPLYRLRASVGVSYQSDITFVMQVLRSAATGLSWRVADRDPQVILTGFADSAITFEVQVWTHDPWSARRATSALNEAVWLALRQANVSIPFPQLDVHLAPSGERGAAPS